MLIAEPNGDWKMPSQDPSSLLKVIVKIIKVFIGKRR
ncbi:hypothetical protein HMPREF0669_02040 [Prevotella sp. oral taxon 299 str. F0039]|nr:hypothetical protein HMPREF0669_02040 [Prevotella sp. oral taxon 299 str. F0039]